MKRTTANFRSALTRLIVPARAQKLATGSLLLLLLGGAGAAQAQNGMVIADFNHDGIPDVMLPNAQPGNFTISFGAVPYGSFRSTAVLVPYPAGCTEPIAGSPVAGDFNGDGIPDLALTCYGATGSTPSLYVMLGNGDGTFRAPTTLAGLTNVVLGDFDHDGKLDVVVEGASGNGGNSLFFYPGNGDGTFAAAYTSSMPSTYYSSPVAVDLNNDGYPDLVFGNFASSGNNSADVFGNNRNGTFGQYLESYYGPNASIDGGPYGQSIDTAVLTGKFFGTGLPDIGIVDTGSFASGVFLAKNTSTVNGFSFSTSTKLFYDGTVGASAASFTSPATDLVFYSGSTYQVLANDGLGNFSNSYPSLAATSASSVFATADANGDGHADLYVATTSSGSVSLTVDLLTGTATATSAPFSLPAGTAALSATWPGNFNFTGSTATGTQTVAALASTTSIASSLNPAFASQSVTFTAAVTPAVTGTFVPSGTVIFTDNGNPLGSGTIGTGGSATVTTSALTVGAHTILATYGGNATFSGSSMSLSQQVNSNTPTISWATPAPITYGTALTAAQLNATAANTAGAAVAGTFVYTPALGTVPSAGQQTLSVVFTPTNTALYSTATGTTSILVIPATPVVSWTPAVSAITYGTALGAPQLNATATGVGGAALAGTFTYNPAAGTVLNPGQQTLSVIFTPTNTTLYTTATGSASILVNAATPTVSWTPAVNSISYGTALGVQQLNATATGVGGATVAGTFAYTPAAGTVLNPGQQTLSVVFTPTNTTLYTTATGTTSITVGPAAPVIGWTPAVGSIVYGTALGTQQLNATATGNGGVTVAGTFVYTPAPGAILNAGTQTLSVTFTPTNTTLYSTVTKTASLTVTPATATIAWTPAVTSIVYGTALGAQQLNATATGVGGAAVTGTFVYTPASGAVLTAGTQSLGVVFTSTNANYVGASGTAAITVTRATPALAWTTPATIAYGIPLGATQLNATSTGVTGVTLPGAFVYTPASGAVLTPGTQTLSTTFTPTDLVDYLTATKTVSLTITDIALTSFTPNTATIGDPNKTVTITGSGFVANTVAQINGVAVATTYTSPTSLTAVIPAASFSTTATLLLTLKSPATGSVSGSLPLVVSAPPVTATFAGPSTTAPGSQPVLNLTIPSYPVALTATLTLNSVSSLASGVTDPNVLFANGLTTYTFTIPAGTTTIPTIQLQAGTVAETITVPLVLTVNGVNVTPTGLNPVVITVPAAVPVPTAATLQRSGNQITVTVDGFSNTREIVSASFTFVPAPGASLSTTQISAPVGAVFTTYFATPASIAAGSSFIYTQVFNVNGDANSIGSVIVTLTNSIGTSITYTAQ